MRDHTQEDATGLVHVPTLNLVRPLYEHTIPQEYEIAKMDIEGAERAIIPDPLAKPEPTLPCICVESCIS